MAKFDLKSTGARGSDKIKNYGWSVKDEQGLLLEIDKSDLEIDMRYQRDLIHAKVLNIASSWSWIACGAILVGHRDSKFYVIDGQHRVAAAMKRSDISLLPCVVFETDSVSTEASGFIGSNTLRKPVAVADRMRALVVAGDETAKFVSSVLDDVGLEPTRYSTQVGTIKCLSTCLRLANADKDRFRRVIRIASKICGDDGIQVPQPLLGGLAYIDAHIEDGVENRRLQDRLIQCGGIKLIAAISRANSFFSKGGDKSAALGIIEEVNRRMRVINRFDLDGNKGT